MIVRLLLPLALLAAPAFAAERRIGIGSFDRIRVDGPFEVRVTTGKSPGASISGDRQRIDSVEVRVDGSTLVVRRGTGGWGERPQGVADVPMVVALSTPALVSAGSLAGGRLAITGMKGDRIDLSVTGAGAITVAMSDAAQLNATVIGAGMIAVAGRATRARLLTNGPGSIDAGALSADDLTVRLDGVGETKAHARYTAIVDNVGLGRIDVAGSPRCVVKARAGGPVSCGSGKR